MQNLLEETLKFLEENGKSPADVEWIGSESYGHFDWEHFESVADVEYHAGYGAQEVACDLVIVGDGWWMERVEYDGAEGWGFKTPPTRPDDVREVKRLVDSVKGWEGLRDLNG